MARDVDRKKLAEWRRRLARHQKSGLTVAEFCRRERVKVSLWKYWRRQVDRLPPQERLAEPFGRVSAAFEPVGIIPRRSVLVRFPGGSTLEIPDDRVDLVRLAIDRMAFQPEAAPC